MAFHVHITAYLNGLDRKLEDLSEAEHQVAVYAKNLADPYVPKRTGALSRSARVDGNIVSYNTVYAHRQYVTTGQHHPNGGQSYWFWGMRKDHASELRREAASAILKELRNPL